MATVESHCLPLPEETRGKEWSWSLMRAIAMKEGSPGRRQGCRKAEQMLKQQRGEKGQYISGLASCPLMLHPCFLLIKPYFKPRAQSNLMKQSLGVSLSGNRTKKGEKWIQRGKWRITSIWILSYSMSQYFCLTESLVFFLKIMKNLYRFQSCHHVSAGLNF